MKKKNLLILLIIPFLISTLTIVSVNVTYNFVDVDISHIEWSYNDVEAFQIAETLYRLEAKGVNQRHTEVGSGNDLVWTVTNIDGEAEIVNQNGSYFLKAIKSGEVRVTCSNEKGNVSRSFDAIVYKDGAILINSLVSSSNYDKIDKTEYYGQFDFNPSGGKTNAQFNISVKLIPENLISANPRAICSDNISIDIAFDTGKVEGGGYLTTGTVTINGEGDAKIDITTDLEETIQGGKYPFVVVKDGVNVYTYDQLLNCTNRSKEGEVVVLHKSFESYNTYINSSNRQNIEVFGYNDAYGRFSFSTQNGTVCKVPTKFNHEYLDQWNKANPTNQVEASLYVGLLVKKDFYGNGYCINFHNLAYPSSTTTDSSTGVISPQLSNDDLFRGPLPFYTIGSPTTGSNEGFNLVTAYGQDNIGFYIEGDNITVNDLVVQNCDDVNVFKFLDNVGTVVEVDGDNVTLKNMRMSNGRTVLRSFSNQNLLVDNCMLSNARNFLFVTGANEYEKANYSALKEFVTANSTVNQTIAQFISKNGYANPILSDFINGKVGSQYSFKNKETMKQALLSIQDAMTVNLKNQFKGSTELKNCMFYRSGISSVAFESLFNGPFLFNGELPNDIAMFRDLLNQVIVGNDFVPSNVSGTSYPVSVNVSGNTKFYDYKVYNELDLSGLIKENISTLLQSFFQRDIPIDIDRIFPVKSLLSSNAVYYKKDGKSYTNIPFVYYGGGANYSKLTFNGYEDNHINGRLSSDGTLDQNAVKNVDLLDQYLDYPVVKPIQMAYELAGVEVDENTLIKTVTIVTGYEPFKFVFNKGDGYLFGESPKIEKMQEMANITITEEAYNG